MDSFAAWLLFCPVFKTAMVAHLRTLTGIEASRQENLLPTRYLKSEICDSETLDSLSPLAEVLFYRLLVTVDDFGRLDARQSYVKAKCFPVRDSITAKDCEKLLIELHEKRVIFLYEIDSRRYLQMSKWTNKPRSDTSKYPAKITECIQVYTDVKQCKANPPVTVTETVTVTSTKVQSLTLPDYVSQTIFMDFRTHRTKIKKPMTDHAASLLIKELVKLKESGYDPNECLNTAIMNGWQMPYAPKDGIKINGAALKCPDGFPFSEWMKASQAEKQSIIGRHNVKTG
jgi:hypothetical protein